MLFFVDTEKCSSTKKGCHTIADFGVYAMPTATKIPASISSLIKKFALERGSDVFLQISFFISGEVMDLTRSQAFLSKKCFVILSKSLLFDDTNQRSPDLSFSIKQLPILFAISG